MRQPTSKFFTTKEEMNDFISKNNFYIIEESLGAQVAGYYNNTFGEKLIHVNSKIQSYYKPFVIAYFLLREPNKCTHEKGLSFLTMNKLKELPRLENLLEFAS